MSVTLKAPFSTLPRLGRYDQARIRQGLTIASASLLPVPSGGAYTVSGTTNIDNLPNLGGGNLVLLRFQGILQLKHSANLLCPSQQAIVTAANDVAELWELTPGVWTVTHYNRDNGLPLFGGKLIQSIADTDGSYTTGTALFPFDDTIPQSGEGFAYSALDVSITPTNASGILRVHATVWCIHSTGISPVCLALFRDSGANALKAAFAGAGTSIGGTRLTLTHDVVAGATSATTFKLRLGARDAGTLSLNGSTSARLYGGVLLSTHTVSEISP